MVHIDYIRYVFVTGTVSVEKDLLHVVIKACSSNTIVAVFIATKTASRKPVHRFTFTLLEHITAPFTPVFNLHCIGDDIVPLIRGEKKISGHG